MIRMNSISNSPCRAIDSQNQSGAKRIASSLHGQRRRRSRVRSGLSLLEVILSIAILGMALIVIGELIRIGFRSATSARVRSEAQMACDTKMSEIVAGVLPLESTSGTKIEESPDWEYDVVVDQAEIDGLLLVRVVVRQTSVADPLEFDVWRYLPDPDYDPTELQN